MKLDGKMTKCTRPFENEETKRMCEQLLHDILNESFEGWYRRLGEERYKELMAMDEGLIKPDGEPLK